MNPEQEVGKPKSSLAGDIDGNRKSSCQHWKKEQENVGPPLNEVIGPHGKGQGINQGTPWLHHDFINKSSLPHFHCTWPHLYNTQDIYCMHMATEGINPCVSLISVNLLLIIFERFWLWGGGSRELRGKKKRKCCPQEGGNYRLVSLTSILGNVIEKINLAAISKHNRDKRAIRNI